MSLWKDRDSYTNSKLWPVVPFRLTKYDEEEKYKLLYNIGLDKNLVLGWTMGLSESFNPHHPVMVWEKKCIGLQRNVFVDNGGGCLEYSPQETLLYYDLLSSVCSHFRKYDDFFCLCRKQDENVVNAVFQALDRTVVDADGVFSLPKTINIDNINGHCNDKKLTINIINNNGKMYFEYRCPCFGMLELIFPVMCEGITIALIVCGQIIDNKEDIYKNVCNYNQYNIDDIKWGDIQNENINNLIKIAFDEIEKLEADYMQQVQNERLKIMNKISDEIGRRILIKSSNEVTSIKKLIKNKVENIKEAKKILIDQMGIDNMFIYLDESSLKSVVNKDGKFYLSLLYEIHSLSEVNKPFIPKWFTSLKDVGDLFDTDSIPSDERPKYVNENGESKDKWSVFIAALTREDEPIVIGIKYAGKKRFLRYMENDDLFFENYLLPKFATLVQNALLSVEAQKQALVLDDNRKRLSHEMGQIAAGVRALNKSFSRYILTKKIEAQTNRENIGELFEKIIKKAELYKGDIQGQFDIVEMMSKVHGNDVIPKIKEFDLWTEFFHRWHLIFNSQCSVNNQFLEMPFKSFNEQRQNNRIITTDPLLLQCALYNVVNNAIKYCYVNTRITIEFNKQIEPEKYIFTVKNYGSFLDSNDRSIYERGVRYPRHKGTVDFTNDATVIGEGLGLYWSELLINKLGGIIYHECSAYDEPLSKYHVPLMEPFFKRYNNYAGFRIAWDNAYNLGFVEKAISEQAYDDIKLEYEALKKKGYGKVTYDEIVNNWQIQKLDKISFFKLYTDMSIPTYEIIFKIEIPKYEKGNRV